MFDFIGFLHLSSDIDSAQLSQMTVLTIVYIDSLNIPV